MSINDFTILIIVSLHVLKHNKENQSRMLIVVV